MSEPDPTLSPRIAQAGADIYRAICDSIADARGSHLETAVAAAGYLAGTAILTNCGVNLSALTPGAPVFVDRVNEVGPVVVKYLMDLVANGSPPAASIPPDRQPLRSYDVGDLEQILPDTRAGAFVGTRPRVQDKVSEPILVIVDNQSGAVSTTSLWQ